MALILGKKYDPNHDLSIELEGDKEIALEFSCNKLK